MGTKGGRVIVTETKIGLIGGGSMGEAFVGALAKSVISDSSMIIVSDVSDKRLAELRNTYGVSVTADNSRIFAECNVIILAVKPQQMGEVLSGISEKPVYRITERKVVVSIAAGISLKKIEDLLYTPLDEASKERLPIIRVMPNTPALVLAGMSGMSANRYALDEDRAVARNILSSMGRVIEFEENDLNAVTALSGSGPAYVFYLVESMIAAGIKTGLSSDDASVLTLTTLKGALALLEGRSASAEQLREQVTSPGGTTEAAFRVLDKNGVKESIIDAICEAKHRAEELSSIS